MCVKKVVISCGPIPARLDSVKFITNRFKGGLAFKTGEYLANEGHEVTVVAWKFTDVPESIKGKAKEIIQVADVFEYYDWYKANAQNYNAFVMAAAVANLTPVNPYEGKFPSHNYKSGDEFDIKFMIAPRAIDVIKSVNPRACLIGYKLFDAQSDEELIDIARHTQADAKANIIFANTPKDAKTRKLAVLADNSVIPCTFEEHLELMNRAITAEYFKTIVSPLTREEEARPEVQMAFAAVECFERTFQGFGTVAVPAGLFGFATTARGHKGGPVLVRRVSIFGKTIEASAKATLNTPALSMAVKRGLMAIHRHPDDLQYDTSIETAPSTFKPGHYLFPGSVEEAMTIKDARNSGYQAVKLPYHGYIAFRKMQRVDWSRYHELFPAKYFSIPKAFASVLNQYKGKETLEVGGNKDARGKYAFDPYAPAKRARNLRWEDVQARHFDLIFLRNAINYIRPNDLETYLEHTGSFIANTFLVPPDKKVTSNEAAVRVGKSIYHILRLPDDSIMDHSFHAYDQRFYESLGLTVIPYGRNSALVVKGLDAGAIREQLEEEYTREEQALSED